VRKIKGDMQGRGNIQYNLKRCLRRQRVSIQKEVGRTWWRRNRILFCIIDKLLIVESAYDHFGKILGSYLSDQALVCLNKHWKDNLTFSQDSVAL
jgi:hypothetical protein